MIIASNPLLYLNKLNEVFQFYLFMNDSQIGHEYAGKYDEQFNLESQILPTWSIIF